MIPVGRAIRRALAAPLARVTQLALTMHQVPVTRLAHLDLHSCRIGRMTKGHRDDAPFYVWTLNYRLAYIIAIVDVRAFRKVLRAQLYAEIDPRTGLGGDAFIGTQRVGLSVLFGIPLCFIGIQEC